MSDRKRRDRDVRVDYHTPNRGVPVPVAHETTDQCETPLELRNMRSRRSTQRRLERLETKHDDLVKVVTETRIIVGEMTGKLDVLPDLVSTIKDAADRAVAREDANHLDSLDAKKSRRKLLAIIAGAVASGGAIGKILHEMGVL